MERDIQLSNTVATIFSGVYREKERIRETYQ